MRVWACLGAGVGVDVRACGCAGVRVRGCVGVFFSNFEVFFFLSFCFYLLVFFFDGNLSPKIFFF